MIKACANQAALEQGAQLHAQVVKLNFDGESYISAGLVDMYGKCGKCGLFDYSIRVFNGTRNPTEISWNSFLSVFAQHGFGKEVVRLFNKMVLVVKPNAISFTGLLIGCSHAGFVEEGSELLLFHGEDIWNCP